MTDHATRPFRFAVQGGPFADADALRAHARHVEELGYEELYAADHIGYEATTGGGARVDPFVSLVVAAEATERLRVGPLVLNNEFHHPALLARTAATFDRLTGGRLVLGLGTGYAVEEHDAIGSPIRPPGQRVTRFGESLEILRSLLDTGAADVHGQFEQVSIEALGIRPEQAHVPFLIGGHGRRVVELAARYADIFQFTGLTQNADGSLATGGFSAEAITERAEWLAAAAGDRDDAIERSSLVQFTHVGPDAPSSADMAERFELDADIVEQTPFALFGSLEQVIDQIERQRETLGISHYAIRDAEGFAPVVEALAGR